MPHARARDGTRGPSRWAVRFMVECASMSAPARAHLYWRRLRLLSTALLLCWLAVTLAVPWFAADLNAWRIGRFPLGFWLSSQGALIVFVVLIIVYVWVVERLDHAWHAAHGAEPPDGNARACLARDDLA
jgi:putative solute:sodium symporter small subunit